MREAPSLLAQVSDREPQPEGDGPTPEQAAATREWAILMLVLVLLAIVALSVLTTIVLARRRHLARRSPERAPAAGGDPWFEAGKRLEAALDASDAQPLGDELGLDQPLADNGQDIHGGGEGGEDQNKDDDSDDEGDEDSEGGRRP